MHSNTAAEPLLIDDLEFDTDGVVDDIRESWERAVGRFILAFGVIERCSFDLIMALADASFEDAERMTIGTRFAVARRQLRFLGASASIRVLDEALALVAVRNIIAHGRLQWVEKDGGHASFMRSHRGNGERLWLPDLEQHAERAKSVGAELFQFISDRAISSNRTSDD
jgi:hypothetical protein